MRASADASIVARGAMTKGHSVSDNTYAVTELVGTSTTGIDDAIKGAVSKASQTLRNLDWFEVTKISGHIDGGDVAHFQVMLKIGFRYDD
jgi:flavin-binding protein dodecin